MKYIITFVMKEYATNGFIMYLTGGDEINARSTIFTSVTIED